MRAISLNPPNPRGSNTRPTTSSSLFKHGRAQGLVGTTYLIWRLSPAPPIRVETWREHACHLRHACPPRTLSQDGRLVSGSMWWWYEDGTHAVGPQPPLSWPGHCRAVPQQSNAWPFAHPPQGSFVTTPITSLWDPRAADSFLGREEESGEEVLGYLRGRQDEGIQGLSGQLSSPG